MFKFICGAKVYYLIEWLDYPEEASQWIREENLKCPKLLEEFKMNRPQNTIVIKNGEWLKSKEPAKSDENNATIYEQMEPIQKKCETIIHNEKNVKNKVQILRQFSFWFILLFLCFVGGYAVRYNGDVDSFSVPTSVHDFYSARFNASTDVWLMTKEYLSKKSFIAVEIVSSKKFQIKIICITFNRSTDKLFIRKFSVLYRLSNL